MMVVVLLVAQKSPPAPPPPDVVTLAPALPDMVPVSPGKLEPPFFGAHPQMSHPAMETRRAVGIDAKLMFILESWRRQIRAAAEAKPPANHA
jgi:hypothetical protein